MRKRGCGSCNIGALPKRTKIIVGVGLAVAAAGLGYVVYRATKKKALTQTLLSNPQQSATLHWTPPQTAAHGSGLPINWKDVGLPTA